MATKKVRYYTKTYENTTCYVFEFTTDANSMYQLVHGWDSANDKYGKQVLSKHADGYLVSMGYKPVAKINAGFFYGSAPWTGFDMQFPSIGMCWRTNDGTPLLSNENGSAASNGWHLLYNANAATPYLSVGFVDLVRYEDPLWGITLSYRLLDNGSVAIHNGGSSAGWSSITGTNPRTLVGWKADGTNVWVVTGGRGVNGTGLTQQQSANLMLQLGCTHAINADGGGSSEMIVNGSIKNSPTDGSERAVATSLILYSLDDIEYVGEGEPIVDPNDDNNTENDDNIEEKIPFEGFKVYNENGNLKEVLNIWYFDENGERHEVSDVSVYDETGALSDTFNKG